MNKIKFKSRFTPEQKLLFAIGGVPAEYAQAWAEEKAAREAAQREQDIQEALELCQKAQREVVEGVCKHAEWVPGTYNTYPAALAVVGGKIYRYIHSGVCAEEDYLPLVSRYDGVLLPGQVDPAIAAEQARLKAEAEQVAIEAEKAEKARLKEEAARAAAEAEKARIDARIEAKRAARLAYAAERERAAAEARQARIDAAESAAREKEAAKAAEAAAFRAASNPFAALAALKGGK